MQYLFVWHGTPNQSYSKVISLPPLGQLSFFVFKRQREKKILQVMERCPLLPSKLLHLFHSINVICYALVSVSTKYVSNHNRKYAKSMGKFRYGVRARQRYPQSQLHEIFLSVDQAVTSWQTNVIKSCTTFYQLISKFS